MRPSFILVSAVCTIIWQLQTLPAWSQSENAAKLLEGAKREGQLNWYTSMGAGDLTKYVELFNAKYSFVRVNVRRVSGERLITIITTEHRAGKVLFDLVGSSGVAPSFIKSGIFAKYLSPEYKFFPPEQRTRRATGRTLTPTASRFLITPA